MNRYPMEKPPRWWGPKLSPGWIRVWSRIRKWHRASSERLVDVEVRNAHRVREAVARNEGVLITPNHSSHADCHTIYAASDAVGVPFYVMVAWQVFQNNPWLKRLGLQHHGCFSVDREGTDVQAFRQAVDVLQSRPNPLAVFPEGEVYHLNERITPFRQGPAAMALLAARKGSRPIVCFPCAIRYQYVEDPTPELLRLMSRLEEAIFWRPRPDLSLPERVYHFAEGILALKEIEFTGRTSSGPLPQRIAALIEFLLGRLEARHAPEGPRTTVPERIKSLRQHLIQRLVGLPEDDPARRECEDDLDDVFFVVQVFSYPGNYVAERPSIERIAETLDKFEEDVLRVKIATIRGARKVTFTFGEPIRVGADRDKNAAANLTRLLEQRVQALLDAEGAAGGQARKAESRIA